MKEAKERLSPNTIRGARLTEPGSGRQRSLPIEATPASVGSLRACAFRATRVSVCSAIWDKRRAPWR
jgi:hypothetical protein